MATKTASRKRTVGRPSGSLNQYPINLSATIRTIIEDKKRFLHQREIVSILAKKAGKVTDQEEFSKKTSVLLSALKSRNSIVQYSASDSTRERYYGNPKWLKRNKPVAGFEPK